MRKQTTYAGPWIIIVLSLLPLAFWAAMMPLRGRFFNFTTTLTSLGQMTALVGMAMFSLVLILHARIRWTEGLFGGLDGVYCSHHSFGAVSFILLLFHPLFLAARFISVSVRDAALFLLPGADFSINLGIIAIILLEALIIITFFFCWKYQKWKASHSFLGLAFFIASLFVSFTSKDVAKEWHPFTISSGSGEKNLRFTVKNLGDYTATLPLLKKGDRAIVEGPFGHFSSELYQGKDQLWIAGGIGITPFLSMARSLYGSKKITLVYCVGNAGEAVCLDELKAIQQKSLQRKGFKVILHPTSKEGYLTAEKVQKGVKDIAQREIFLCGPPGMMAALTKQLGQIGAKAIHTEEFDIR